MIIPVRIIARADASGSFAAAIKQFPYAVAIEEKMPAHDNKRTASTHYQSADPEKLGEKTAQNYEHLTSIATGATGIRFDLAENYPHIFLDLAERQIYEMVALTPAEQERFKTGLQKGLVEKL